MKVEEIFADQRGSEQIGQHQCHTHQRPAGHPVACQQKDWNGSQAKRQALEDKQRLWAGMNQIEQREGQQDWLNMDCQAGWRAIIIPAAISKLEEVSVQGIPDSLIEVA